MEKISRKRKIITLVLVLSLIGFGIFGKISTSFAEDYEKVEIWWTLVDANNQPIPGMENDSKKEMYVSKSDKEKLSSRDSRYLGRLYTAGSTFFSNDTTKHEELKESDYTEAMKLFKSGKLYWDASGNKPYSMPDLSSNLKNEKENSEDASKAIKPGIMEKIIRALFKIQIKNPLDGKKIAFFDIGPTCERMLLFGHVSGDGSGLAKDSGISDSGQITDIAQAVNKAVTDIGLSLVLMGVLLYMLREVLEHYRAVHPGRVLMILMRGAIWGGVVGSSWYIMSGVMSIGDWLSYKILGIANITSGKSAKNVATLADSVAGFLVQQTLFNKVISFVLCLALWFMCIGTAVAIFTFVATRMIRILVNIAFAPIPLALCSYDQTKQFGNAYVMNMLAAGIEATIVFFLLIFYMMAVNSIGTDLVGTAANGTLLNMIRYLLYIVTLNSIFAGAIQSSTQMARDMIGA